MGPSAMRRVIVVGTGFSGLTTAVRLQSAGMQVLLLERDDQPAPLLGRIALADCYFDRGPSLCMMPQTLGDLFSCIGMRLEEALDLLPVAPCRRYVFPDGKQFDFTDTEESLREQVHQFSPDDAERLAGHLRYSRRLFQALQRGPWKYPRAGWRDSAAAWLHPRTVLRWPWLLNPRGAGARVRSAFHHPQLRRIFEAAALELGTSPDDIPAPAALWMHHAWLRFRMWYPRGGMNALRKVLLRLCEEKGIPVHCGLPVVDVICRQGRCWGVVTADGRGWEADAVVWTGNPVGLMEILERALPKKTHWWKPRKSDPLGRRIRKRHLSCSRLTWLWACNRQWPLPAHRTLFFSPEAREESTHLHCWQVGPPEPTIYVENAARTDPSLAPPGFSTLRVWIDAPSLSPRWQWNEEHIAQYRSHVLGRLTDAGLEGLEDSIVGEQCITPMQLEEEHLYHRGAVWGPSCQSLSDVFGRFPNSHPAMTGLFLAGVWTHPGPLLPQLALGTKSVTRMVEKLLVAR